MNWILVPVGLLLLALLIFLVVRNQRDKEELEDKLNKDYRKPRDEEGDVQVEETLK